MLTRVDFASSIQSKVVDGKFLMYYYDKSYNYTVAVFGPGKTKPQVYSIDSSLNLYGANDITYKDSQMGICYVNGSVLNCLNYDFQTKQSNFYKIKGNSFLLLEHIGLTFLLQSLRENNSCTLGSFTARETRSFFSTTWRTQAKHTSSNLNSVTPLMLKTCSYCCI